MGQKLIQDGIESFDPVDPEKVDIYGISGGCYCCGQQLHVPFKNIDVLPVARIEETHFYVIVCDQCEADTNYLKERGVPDISYDVLWMIQHPLDEKLIELDNKIGGISDIERNDILYKMYVKTIQKIKAKIKKEEAKKLNKL